MRRRWAPILLMIALMLTVIPLPVSANSPMPMPWYDFVLSNIPEGTVYVDLLIRLPESDPMYTQLNREQLPAGFSEDAQIITFCEEDYRSYTFHYVDALSSIRPDNFSTVHFFTDKEYDLVRYDHTEQIYQTGTVKLAMLDGFGNILKISPELILRPKEFMTYITGTFFYDCKTDDFRVDSAGAGVGRVLFVFICLMGAALTCIVERLVAIPFNLNKQYGRLIVRTNIYSQVLMYAGYALLYGLVFWKYTYATILLEVMVYLGEYLIYRRIMISVPHKTRFIYVISANTASLVLGMLIYRLLIF